MPSAKSSSLQCYCRMDWIVGRLWVVLLGLLLWLPSLIQAQDTANEPPFSNCALADYYNQLEYTNRTALTEWLQETHRNIVPYHTASTVNDNQADVWSALIALYPGATTDTVRLLYTEKEVPITAQASLSDDGWNRDHLWPREYGIGDSGADGSDLHALVPTDWNVNAVRSNKYFGSCVPTNNNNNNNNTVVVPLQDESCLIPATYETSLDTSTSATTFLPPPSVRGDIARALMYMDLRYNGHVNSESNLQLTNCPPSSTTRMGYLSELWQWHLDDPVSDDEQFRNNEICTNWQGNRNPLIDLPDLVTSLFERNPQEDCSVIIEVEDDGNEEPEDDNPPPTETTLAPTEDTMSEDNDETPPPVNNQLPYVEPTGIPPFSNCETTDYYSSLPNTSPSRTVLEELLQSTHQNRVRESELRNALIQLYGTQNEEDESMVRLPYSRTTVSAADESWIPHGLWPSSRGVGSDGLDATDLHHMIPSYPSVGQARGDRTFGPCLVEGEDCAQPAAILAAFDTTRSPQSFLPPRNVRGDIARALFYMDVRYTGHRARERDLQLRECPTDATEYGILSQLLEWHIEDPVSASEVIRNAEICQDYQGNRNPFVDFEDLALTYYQGMIRTTCRIPNSPLLDDSNSCPSAGSVMVIGFNSDFPDDVAFVALDDLAEGTILYVTDNAWTGTQLRDIEGYLRLQVPSGGIPAGSVFGYSQSSSETGRGVEWPVAVDLELVRGNFDLSASGDNIFVLCDDRSDGLIFVSALAFGGRWTNYGGDTTYSALPTQLVQEPNSFFITLEHYDNYRYSGTTFGTAFRLREAISDPTNWEFSNDNRYPSFIESFVVLEDEPGEDTIPPTSSPVEAPSIASRDSGVAAWFDRTTIVGLIVGTVLCCSTRFLLE